MATFAARSNEKCTVNKNYSNQTCCSRVTLSSECSNKVYGKDLVETLQDICKPDKISEVKIILGCDGVDSFLSVLHCIEVTTNRDDMENVKKFVQKKIRRADSLFMTEIIYKAGIFQRESEAYRTVFKAMTNFLNYKERSSFTGLPVCKFFTSWLDGHSDYILLEDVRQYGFAPANSKIGLSNAEIWFALKELAKFHSISYAMALDEGKKIEEIFPSIKYPKEFLESKEEKQIHSIHFRAALDMLFKTGNEGLVEKLSAKLKGKEIEIGQKMLAYSGPFRVLCHGDFWTNNLLFKYDGTGKPIGMTMVDFQWIKPVSAVFDFGYFIYTSTKKKQRQDFLNDWIELYFQHFKDTVTSLNVEFPESLTLESFKEELNNAMVYFIPHMSFALAVQNNFDHATTNRESISEGMDATPTVLKELQQQAKERMASKSVQDALISFFVEMQEIKVI